MPFINKWGYRMWISPAEQKEKGVTMQAPTIHLNGTGKNALLNETEAAYRALGDAIDSVENITVHMRDYYVKPDGPEAYQEARKDMDRRLKVLHEVRDEVLWIHGKILEQGKA